MGSPSLPLRGDYATLNDDDVAYFRQVLEEGSSAYGDGGSAKQSSPKANRKVLVDAPSLAAANEDWMKKYRGNSKVLLLPSNTQEVALILKHCNDRKLAVVPQGGNTGLVGGGVPVHDEVIVNLKNMNQMVSVDKNAGVLVAEAGVVLEDLEGVANEHGLTVPLDLGAKGKCQIGGNVSTNAGGLRLVKFGSLRGTVLGLEVVTATGAILDLLRTLRKDNTGYDLKQLFIGGEGTLGVVTKVAILAPPKPAATNVAFIGVGSFSAAVVAMRLAKQSLGGNLSAFEFLDRRSLDLVLKQLKGTRDPLPSQKAPFYVVVEVAETGEGDDSKNSKNLALKKSKRSLHTFCQILRKKQLATGFVVGQNPKHAFALWNLRERISLALKHAGAVYKYDLSVPVETMYEVVDLLRARVARMVTNGGVNDSKASSSFDFSQVSVMGYGHLGDGNLHLNISSPGGYDEQLLNVIEPFVYEWTSAKKGSVSAEHGIGVMKPNELVYSKPAEAIQLMKGVKKLFDPNGILNPYKVLPGGSTDTSTAPTELFRAKL
tara:strand:+ start:325 stop:1956 length:1632 start_codon:yes stop_codon:yes gene_type:complete